MNGTTQVSRILTQSVLDSGGAIRHTHNIICDSSILWGNFGLQFMATPGTVVPAHSCREWLAAPGAHR